MFLKFKNINIFKIILYYDILYLIEKLFENNGSE